MKRFILSAGVAALAITTPAMAGPGGGHGGGHGGHAAKAQHGGGHAKAQRGGGHAKAQRGGGSKQHAQRTHARKQQRAEKRAHAPKQQHAQKRDHAPKQRHVMRMADTHGPSKAHRQAAKPMKMVDRKPHNERVREVRRDRDRDTRVAVRDLNRDRQRFVEDDRDLRRFSAYDDDRWINRSFADNRYSYGCPPGLAAKHNGCLPPGQAKKLIGNRLPAAYRDSMLPVRLRDYYRDSDDYYYRYGDGYLYRVNRQNNLVAALLPLFGSALGLGTPFPASYSNYYVPSYYQSFYPDTRDDYYRYANGNVYAIDRGTGLIEDVVPLIAGGYGVGQVLPAGYSAYNVPYAYRDYYRDSGDAYYRYAPGAIYQVDPRTNLVTSVASLLTPSGFAVGQPLPAGYGAYNVPYQYRSQYYDTPDSWYRYNNGYIYQVDPTTQLISAVIRAIV